MSRAEREYLHMPTLLEEALSLVKVGVWEIDVSTNYLSWTDETFRIHETTPSEYTPTVESAIAFYAPSSVPIVSAAVKAAIENGQEFSLELDLITAKKRFIHVEVQGKAIFENGQVVKVVGAFRDITEKKKAAERLEKSEERFRLAVSAHSAMVYDLDLLTMRMNKIHGLFELIGYELNELEFTIEWWDQQILPEDLGRCHAVLQDVIDGNLSNLEVHYRIRHKNGRILYVEARTFPILDDNGKVVRLVGTVVDVTDRKEKEEEIKQREDLIRLFVEKAPAPIAMFDNEMRYVSASRRWSIDFGLGDREIIGRSHYEIFPEIPERWKEIHRRCLAGATEKLDEDYFILLDGHTDWVRAEVNPWYDKYGKIGGIIIFSDNITDRKLAEEEKSRLFNELKQEKEKLSSLINSMSDEVWFSNNQKQFTLVNPPVLKEFGLGLSTTKDINTFVESLEMFRSDGSPRPVEEAPILQALQGKVLRNLEEIIRSAITGEMRYRQVNANPVRDANGNIIGAVSVVRYITEQKQMEKALLEAKIAAETANIAKSQFLSMMSHEIRTPLNVIMGFSDLLAELDPISELNQYHKKKMDYANRIKRNGQLLVHLIDEILDLSKVESGNLKIEKTQINLYELISDIRAMMQYQAEQKGLLFSMNMESLLPLTCLTDPTRLKQILLNIIGNAIKFTLKGEVRVVVASPSDSKLHVIVTDTGIGIAPDQACKLFQLFSQADESMSRQYGGTGLGLIISRRLAHGLGGDVVLVESREGLGSTFEITVTLEDVKYNHSQSQSIKRQDETIKKQPRLDGVRVLLAEDMPDNQFLVEKNITLAGGIVEVAIDGKEAVTKALTGYYDIILMDIKMPKLDGYEATKQLRSLGYQSPIIALTAHAMQEDIKRCEEVGCNGHLSKPVEKDKMLGLIFNTMRNK